MRRNRRTLSARRRHPNCSSPNCTRRPRDRRSSLVTHWSIALLPRRMCRSLSVVAPPGYGKTTLLAQWRQRDPSHVAWLSLDRHDNDLGQLLSYTAAALDRVEPVDQNLLKAPLSGHSVAAAASRLAGAMSGMKERVTLVFDHVEQLENDECLDTVAELALHLPVGARLRAGIVRRTPATDAQVARGRRCRRDRRRRSCNGSGRCAAHCLQLRGVELSDASAEKVIERAEGWPVGLYLAALALKAGGATNAWGCPSPETIASWPSICVRKSSTVSARRRQVSHADGRARTHERSSLRRAAGRDRLRRRARLARAGRTIC